MKITVEMTSGTHEIEPEQLYQYFPEQGKIDFSPLSSDLPLDTTELEKFSFVIGILQRDLVDSRIYLVQRVEDSKIKTTWLNPAQIVSISFEPEL